VDVRCFFAFSSYGFIKRILDQAKVTLDLGGAVLGVVAAILGLVSIVITVGADIPILLALATAVFGLYSVGWEATLTEATYQNLRIALYNGCDETTGKIDAVGLECVIFQLEELEGPAYFVFKLCVQLMGFVGLNNSMVVTPDQNGSCNGYENGKCWQPFEITFDFTESGIGWEKGLPWVTQSWVEAVGFVGILDTMYYPKTGVYVGLNFEAVKIEAAHFEMYVPTLDGATDRSHQIRYLSGETELRRYNQYSLPLGLNSLGETYTVEGVTGIILGGEAAIVNSEYVIKSVTLTGRAPAGHPFL
jgi:hypothetical protein